MNYYHRRVREWCAGEEEAMEEGMEGERDTAEVASVGAAEATETIAEEREPELPPFAGMVSPVRVRLRVLVPGNQRERLRLMVVNVRKIRLRVVISKPR